MPESRWLFLRMSSRNPHQEYVKKNCFPQTFAWSEVIFIRQIYGGKAKFWSVGNEHFDVISGTDLSANLSNHDCARVGYSNINQSREKKTKYEINKDMSTETGSENQCNVINYDFMNLNTERQKSINVSFFPFDNIMTLSFSFSLFLSL